MKHVIRFIMGALIAAAVVGCNPAQRQAADETGDRVADKSREVGQQVGTAAQNAALAGKVKAALKLRNGLDTGRIEVKANAGTGTVTLEGSVPDMKQRQVAEEVAKTTDDVRQVENRLAVPPTSASGR